GLSFDRVREEVGHPCPALVLIAFAALGMIHAREGMHEIILDYVHDAELKEKAIKANKIISIAIVAIWVVSIMFIAAPH
ncbi:MAG: succinate dehydrogenase, hydrophobic membrane anchor protein, partial [Methylocystis sp.]